jgi:hypothetical protein
MAGDMIDELVVGVRYALDTASEKKALGSLAVVEEEIAAISSPAIWAGLGVGIAAGIAGLAALATEAVVAADAAHDLGIRMDLTAEEVQTMGYAADRTGTSLDTLAIGYTTLTRNLSAQGAEVKKAWATLKLDPTEYENGAQAVGDVADALKGLSSDAERTRIAMLLFGESGPRLKEFLDQGSEGIADLEAHAKALGFVISDADAELSGHLLDSIDDLGKIASGVGRKIGLALVPALDEAASSAVDWYVANHDIIDQQLDRVTDGISAALDAMLTPLGLATTGVVAFGVAWGAAGAAKAMAGAVAEASPLAAALGSQAKNLVAATAALGPYAVAAAAVALTLDDLNKASEGADSITLRLAGTLGVEGETQSALKSIKTLIGETAMLAWDLGDAFETGIGDALDDLAEKLPTIQPLLDAIKEVLSFGIGDALTGVAGAAQSGISTVTETRSELRQGNYVEAGAGVQKGLAEAITPQFAVDLGEYLVNAFSPAASAPEGIARIADPGDPGYRQPAASVSPAPAVTANVTVNAATSPEEIARIAGQEVERQVLDAQAAVGGQP